MLRDENIRLNAKKDISIAGGILSAKNDVDLNAKVGEIMLGLLDIYIERDTFQISVLVYHINTIGFGEAMKELINVKNMSHLKKSVEDAIALSLSEYKRDIEKCNFFKLTKYKTWNKFFSAHYVIGITYDDEKLLYRIRMPERDKKTKSFGNTVSGFEFKIKKEEFDFQFDDIIKKIMDNLEKYQS